MAASRGPWWGRRLPRTTGWASTWLPSTPPTARRPRLAAGGAGAGQPLCLFHAATLAHLPPGTRAAFREGVLALGQVREVHWLSLEMPGVVHDLAGSRASGFCHLLGLVTVGPRSPAITEVLAVVDPHGARVEWVADPAGT